LPDAPPPAAVTATLTKDEVAQLVTRLASKCQSVVSNFDNDAHNWTVYELGLMALNQLVGPRALHSVKECKTASFYNWANGELERATVGKSR
jgi:hypothetical protein